MTTANRLQRAALLAALFVLVASAADAQDKEKKKPPEQAKQETSPPPKQEKTEALLKALEENRLAIEGLKSEIAKGRAVPSPTASPQQADIKEILKVSQETKELVDSFKPNPIRDWGPVIAALVAGAIAVVSLYYNIRLAYHNQAMSREIARESQETNRQISEQSLANAKMIAQQNTELAKRALQEKWQEEERNRISEKIDGFFGPFLLLRKQSEYLYDTFFMPLRSQKELDDYQDAEGRYRTIIALLRGHQFQGVDAWILKHIVDIGKQCAVLIESKTGMVDDEKLRELLATAKTHYWIISELFEQPDHRIILAPGDDDATKAAKQEIHNKIQEEAKFPRHLTEAVKKKHEELEKKLKSLSEI